MTTTIIIKMKTTMIMIIKTYQSIFLKDNLAWFNCPIGKNHSANPIEPMFNCSSLGWL